MVKASDEVRFHERLKKQLGFRKRDYFRLADLLKLEELDPEILRKARRDPRRSPIRAVFLHRWLVFEY